MTALEKLKIIQAMVAGRQQVGDDVSEAERAFLDMLMTELGELADMMEAQDDGDYAE